MSIQHPPILDSIAGFPEGQSAIRIYWMVHSVGKSCDQPEEWNGMLTLAKKIAMSVRGNNDKNRVIYSVCTLCRDPEKAGFVHGMQIGARLMKELSTEETIG